MPWPILLKLSLLGVDPFPQSTPFLNLLGLDLFSFFLPAFSRLLNLSVELRASLAFCGSGPLPSLFLHRGLFWAFSRLLDLFPTFSGPRPLLGGLGPLLGLLWASGPFPTCSGPLPSLFWASSPVLGLGPLLGLFVGFWASSRHFLGLFRVSGLFEPFVGF